MDFDTLSYKSDKGKGSEAITTNNEVNTKHWSYQIILKTLENAKIEQLYATLCNLLFKLPYFRE